MSEKRVLIYSEGDIDLESKDSVEKLRVVFKEYEKLKGDPFSEVYKGKKVTQTIKVISDYFYDFLVNRIISDESVLGIIKRQIKEKGCEIIVFDNVEFEEMISKYDKSLTDIQKEYVRNINSLTEEREFIKTTFRWKDEVIVESSQD